MRVLFDLQRWHMAPVELEINEGMIIDALEDEEVVEPYVYDFLEAMPGVSQEKADAANWTVVCAVQYLLSKREQRRHTLPVPSVSNTDPPGCEWRCPKSLRLRSPEVNIIRGLEYLDLLKPEDLCIFQLPIDPMGSRFDKRYAFQPGDSVSDRVESMLVATHSTIDLLRMAAEGLRFKYWETNMLNCQRRHNCFNRSINELLNNASKYAKICRLDITDEKEIRFLDFAESLQELKASNSGIDGRALNEARNLRCLDISITPVRNLLPFADTLEELTINEYTRFDRKKLRCLRRLKILRVRNNPFVTNIVSFANTLEVLDASFGSGIDDESLVCARRLRVLYANGNPKITTVAPFAEILEELHAEDLCGIDDKGLESATKLRFLSVSDNKKITTVDPFAETLEELHAEEHFCDSYCGMCDAGLVNARHLKILKANSNNKITTIAPFAETLEILDATGRCGISKQALSYAPALKELNSFCNRRIGPEFAEGFKPWY